MATHSSILAWRIPWTEEAGGLYGPQGHKGSDTTEVTSHTRKLILNLCGYNLCKEKKPGHRKVQNLWSTNSSSGISLKSIIQMIEKRLMQKDVNHYL